MTGSDSDRDRVLQELVESIQALLREMHAFHVDVLQMFSPAAPGNGKAPIVSPAAGLAVVLLIFPTVGANGSTWALTSAQVDEWQQLYPGIDVLQECRNALGWCKANPKKQKTMSGMPKFLAGWLSKAQNSGRGKGQTEKGPGSGSLLLQESGYYNER